MNRREFLKKGLEGIVIASVLLISNCSKNPVDSESNKEDSLIYISGSLNIKFTAQSFSHKDFNIRVEEGIVIIGLKSIDYLNAYYIAKSFRYRWGEREFSDEEKKEGKDREFIFHFPAHPDMEFIAISYSNDINIEYAEPVWTYFLIN